MNHEAGFSRSLSDSHLGPDNGSYDERNCQHVVCAIDFSKGSELRELDVIIRNGSAINGKARMLFLFFFVHFWVTKLFRCLELSLPGP